MGVAPAAERTLSWLRRNRRLMAHYEALPVIAEGFVKLTMINIMLKRLTETKHPATPELALTTFGRLFEG